MRTVEFGLDLGPLVETKMITRLYEVADYMEDNNKLLDADCLRAIIYECMKEMFR